MARNTVHYEDIKQDLAEANANAVHQPTEFEGSMQVPDTAKVLQTKRRKQSFIETLLYRMARMCAARPVMGNMIAVGVALGAIVFLRHQVSLHGFAKYQHYIGIGLLIFVGIQVIKNGTRSLLLPLVAMAMVGGAIISHSLGHHQTLFSYSATFYQYVMIVGIVGLGISVLNID